MEYLVENQIVAQLGQLGEIQRWQNNKGNNCPTNWRNIINDTTMFGLLYGVHKNCKILDIISIGQNIYLYIGLKI